MNAAFLSAIPALLKGGGGTGTGQAQTGGIGAPGLLSIGTQLYGANLMDKAEKARLLREEEQLRRTQAISQRDKRLQASQTERQLQDQQRSTNLGAFQAMAEQRASAREAGKTYSLRNDLMRLVR